MQHNMLMQLVQCIRHNKRNRIWRKFVRVTACVVVFCTTYALILPAITMTAPTHCGKEEHIHTQDCYVPTATVMVCQPELSADVVLHTHSSLCYDGGTLVCTLPEISSHVHSDDCYRIPDSISPENDSMAETVPSQEPVSAETLPQEAPLQGHTHSDSCYEIRRGELTCQQPAETFHTHSDACYGPSAQPACGLEETEAHTHGDGCYESVSTLTCQTPESQGHSHDESCLDEAGEPVCGQEESQGHSHTDGCYTQESRLACTLPEGPGHSHQDTCFETVLTCTVPEVTLHEHGDDCYAQLRELVCGLEESVAAASSAQPMAAALPEPEAAPEPELVCTQQVLFPHTHNDACGDCGLPQVVLHQHTESCFRTVDAPESDAGPLTCTQDHDHTFLCYGSWRLICPLEEHTHDAGCSSDPNADLETASDWEATFAHVELTGNWSQDVLLIAETQLGYTESQNNYTFYEDDPTLPRGYTRYGQWYGVPYGDWCGMFVSFCLHYAGVKEVPLNFGCRPWIEDLSKEDADLYRTADSYTPEPGDIVFFDWDGDKLSDHVGLVFQRTKATEITPAQIKTIEGNSSNRVQYRTYDLTDPCLLGYGDIAAAQEAYDLRHPAQESEPTEAVPELLTQTAETENYTVTVSYFSDLELPEGTQLQVVEYPRDSEIFRQRCREAGYELDWLLNIGFFLDGEELNLDGRFDVTVTSKQGDALGTDITHFAEDGTERITGDPVTGVPEDGQSAVSFTSDSFSDYGGGVAAAAEVSSEAFSIQGDKNYIFTVLAPGEIPQPGKQYIIYYHSTGNQITLLSGKPDTTPGVRSIQLQNLGYYSSLGWGGNSWHIPGSSLTSYPEDGFLWDFVSPNGSLSLQPNRYPGNYLNDTLQTVSNWYPAVTVTNNGSGAAKTITVNGATLTFNFSTGTWGVTNYLDGEDSTTTATQFYIAEIAEEPAYDPNGDYVFQTVDPWTDLTWDDFVIYTPVFGNSDSYVFLGAGSTASYTAGDTLLLTAPITQSQNWSLSAAQLSVTSVKNIAWQMELVDGNLKLISQADSNKLFLSTSISKTAEGSLLSGTQSGQGRTLATPDGSYFLYYNQGTGAWESVASGAEGKSPTVVYFAKVTQNMQQVDPGTTETPPALTELDLTFIGSEGYSDNATITTVTGDCTATVSTGWYWNEIDNVCAFGAVHGTATYGGGDAAHPGVQIFHPTPNSANPQWGHPLGYTVKSGEHLQVRLIVDTAIENVSLYAKATDGTDQYQTLTAVPEEYHTYTMDLSSLAGKQLEYVQVQFFDGQAFTDASYSLHWVKVDTLDPTVSDTQSGAVLTSYDFVTADPSQLVEGTRYAIYCRPNNSGSNQYTFLYSTQYFPPTTVSTSGLGSDSNVYYSSPVTVNGQWNIPADRMGNSIDAFTWTMEKQKDGTILLASQGYDNIGFDGPEYLRITANGVESYFNVEQEYIRLNDISGAGCNLYTPIQNRELSYNSETKTWTSAESGYTFYFASVTEKYEEVPDPSDTFQFTTADPNALAEDTNYVIYTKNTGDTDTYTFLFSSSQALPAVTVHDTGYVTNPVTVGGQWSLDAVALGDATLSHFTWKIEKQEDGTVWLEAQGYDDGNPDNGPEYLAMTGWSLQTWNGADGNNHIASSLASISGAGSIIQNTSHKNGDGSTNILQLTYDETEKCWKATNSGTVIYFAGVTQTSTTEPAAQETFTFTTVNPASLQEDTPYAVYCNPSFDNYVFLGSDAAQTTISVPGTGYYTSPVNVTNSTWSLTDTQMGTTEEDAFTWYIEKQDDGQYYLRSMLTGYFLRTDGGLVIDKNGSQQNASFNITSAGTEDRNAAATMTSGSYPLTYDEENHQWIATVNGTATTVYFASVVSSSPKNTRVFPDGVETGDVEVSHPHFYNFCEGQNSVSDLAGCVYQIRQGSTVVATITTGNLPEITLPELADGTYIIEEVSVPDGYLRDGNPIRSFSISNGTFSGSSTIGIFLNHKIDQLGAKKNASVADYTNRLYEILMSTDSMLRQYAMEPINVLFVVDQSNSMLFPSGLESTGKSVLLKGTGEGNLERMNALDLDTDKAYYVIAKPETSATVYTLWYDGRTWMYQDASYYAKAQQNNAVGYQEAGGIVDFPIDANYGDQDKIYDDAGKRRLAQGGGLGKILGGDLAYGLGEEGKTFEIYTSTNGYNRLHYLKQALADTIRQLSEASTESTVGLIRFTSSVDEANCIPPTQLTPTNVTDLTQKVSAITTTGGTRQDIALQHAWEHLSGTNGKTSFSSSRPTFTVLITDGAPAGSSNLGNPSDAAPDTLEEGTNYSVYSMIRYYANRVKDYSKLMTIGLAMDNVAGGKEVLRDIASQSDYFSAISNADQLMNMLKKLLFSGMAPREKLDVSADITDVISDSFYPVAYMGKGTAGDRRLYSDDTYDWVILQPGEWITYDGGYVGETQGSTGAGQLTRDENGDFRITWSDQILYDCSLVWVHYKTEADAIGRPIVMSEDRILLNNGTLTESGHGRYWFALNDGDEIYAHGEYVNPANSSDRIGTDVPYQFVKSGMKYTVVGKYGWSEGASRPHIQWYTSDTTNYYDIDFDSSFQPYLWQGKIYVKAKEDFIGGNAIDTNKSAKVIPQLNDGDNVDTPMGTVSLDTPTVNVRLLEMNQDSSVVTVFLGDQIENTGSILKNFYSEIDFAKLVTGTGTVLNAVETAEGLTGSTFTPGYSMGAELTEAQWTALVQGEPVTVEYTYDNASSHGPVGSFTFQMSKDGIEGATLSYDPHTATASCEIPYQKCSGSAEAYTLTVTYTAYRLGEDTSTGQRPTANAYNGSAGPGTELGGSNAGGTVQTGLGTVASENTHSVHVIDGAIEVDKVIDESLVSKEDQSFAFLLTHEDGTKIEFSVTVPANGTKGSSGFVKPMKRGTWTLTEVPSDNYHVSAITNGDVRTTCYSQVDSPYSVTFRMGYDRNNQDIIGKDPNDPNNPYTVLLTPNSTTGIYGFAEITNTRHTVEIPVRKTWSGSDINPSANLGDVYVVLYKDGEPVGSDGSHKIMHLSHALTRSRSYAGTFTVSVESLDATDFSVREVEAVSSEDHEGLEGWHRAILEGSGTVLWYRDPVENGGLISVDSRGYLVTYGTEAAEDGTVTQVVTNSRAYELPESGGPGKNWYTLGGMLLMLIALGFFLVYNKERRKEDPLFS